MLPHPFLSLFESSQGLGYELPYRLASASATRIATVEGGLRSGLSQNDVEPFQGHSGRGGIGRNSFIQGFALSVYKAFFLI